MRRVILLMIVTGAGLLGACASYRYVHRTQTGGTIALKGPYEDAMARARGAMEQHCQGPYTIVEEGEAVIGEDTVAQGQSSTQRTRGGSTSAGSAHSSTRDATEWRVTYVCGVQPPAPAPTAAPATPINPPPAPSPAPQQPPPGNY